MLRSLNVILTTGLFILSCSCASTHNMKDDGESFWGGGYLVEQVSEDVYKITAKTNVAQWSDYWTARRMWKKHAKEACKGKKYIESEVNEYTYEEHNEAPIMSIEQLFFRYIVTVKEGIASCTDEEFK